jgi:hypothetical protein
MLGYIVSSSFCMTRTHNALGPFDHFFLGGDRLADVMEGSAETDYFPFLRTRRSRSKDVLQLT